MKIAAAAYPVEALSSWDALRAKLTRWVQDADDADLLVFPEYAGLEAGLIGATAPLSIEQECTRCSDAAHAYWQVLVGLACAHERAILAGSLPVHTAGGWKNRAAFLRPDGQAAFIDKIQLTPWERSETPLTGGQGAGVFQLHDTRLGVLICYDGEFPLQARALHTAGAQVLLLPSATETIAGHTRVHLAARARALESGGQTVLAQLVGTCPQSAFADISTGRAGHYAPPDAGWTPDGILAETALNTAGWSVQSVLAAPNTPEVTIATDWNGQQTAPESPRFAPIAQNLP